MKRRCNYPILVIPRGLFIPLVLLVPAMLVAIGYTLDRTLESIALAGSFVVGFMLLGIRCTAPSDQDDCASCARCGYDVSHANHLACPECGEPISVQQRLAMHRLRHQHDTSQKSKLQRHKALGAAIVLTFCLFLGIAVLVSTMTTRRFSEDQFDDVAIGMSAAEVRAALGEPDFRHVISSSLERWIYYSRVLLVLQDAAYEIRMVNGHVESKHIEEF
jgi:predicted RNA-binding Zn-ribbon protein involved in translation (DUF1610 family)